MSFAPQPRLLEELRASRRVVDDEDGENEGGRLLAAELVEPSDVKFMVTHARARARLPFAGARAHDRSIPELLRLNSMHPFPSIWKTRGEDDQ